MNTEISPTPWGYSVKEDKRVVIEDFLEFPVATTPDPQLFAEDMELPVEEGRGLVLANAEHIVHCVNLHDDLVRALSSLYQMVVADDYSPEARERILDNASNVLDSLPPFVE